MSPGGSDRSIGGLMIICDWCHCGSKGVKRISVTVDEQESVTRSFTQQNQLCETCRALLVGGMRGGCALPLGILDKRAATHQAELERVEELRGG